MYEEKIRVQKIITIMTRVNKEEIFENPSCIEWHDLSCKGTNFSFVEHESRTCIPRFRLEGLKYEYDSQQRVFTRMIGISKMQRVPYITAENVSR